LFISFSVFEVEPWCQTRYSIENIDEDLMRRLKETSTIDLSLTFSLNNQFLAINFDLCAECGEFVLNMIFIKCIVEEDRMKFWFKNDNIFRVPRGGIYERIYFKRARYDAMCIYKSLR
jgi:nardilysin